LLYGQVFTARPIDYKEGAMKYVKGKDNYIAVGRDQKPVYESSDMMFLPRVWDGSNDQGHATFYQRWLNLEDGEKPTMAHNISWALSYQIGWMYLRYFGWNFIGKQNDIQGFGNKRDGNSITGVKAVDNAMLGNQDKIPSSIRDNKANNKLYAIPFILGILGILYQYKRDKNGSFVSFLLFFFTGLAIVFYLNQAGNQPRERDYAYVGSFYAFAIWIGLGVLQIAEWLSKAITPKMATIAASIICFLAVPTLMAQQEWDDHDRSQKTLPRDLARNYLESCPPNAILFSFGDNDTYPLWYAQEVEGIRPDVRVVVNSLLGSDWYMKELRYKVNQSDKFDVIFTDEQVAGNKLNAAYYYPVPGYTENQYYNLDSVLRYVVADPAGKYQMATQDGSSVNIFPTHKFSVPVNKANALASGIAKPTDSIVNELKIDFNPNRQYLVKNEMAIFAIIATSQFKRPICFTSQQDLKDLGLDKYARQTGMAYQLVPVLNSPIDTETAFKNIMSKFTFGNAQNANVYFDEENRRHLNSIRYSIAEIALALAVEGKKDSARQLLHKIDAVTNEKNFPYGMTSNRGNQHNYFSYVFLQACYAADDKTLAKKVSTSVMKDLKQQLTYYRSLGEAMSEDQFMQNADAAYQGKPTALSNKQMSFVQDILTCYQLEAAIAKLETDITTK